MADIEVGSVWADRDPRSGGRTVEVMEIGETHAKVRLNTTARNVSRQAIGRRTTVRLDRFGTDYKRSDVPAHRFGTHKETGELGYWPKDCIDFAYLEPGYFERRAGS